VAAEGGSDASERTAVDVTVESAGRLGPDAVRDPGPARCGHRDRRPADGTSEECTPIAEEITVTLTGVKTDLTMIWDADNTVWLLPAYTFTTDDGGQYQVIAIDDEFIELPEALPVPEPMPVEETVDPACRWRSTKSRPRRSSVSARTRRQGR